MSEATEITKGWLVCNGEIGCMIVDAETASKAKWSVRNDLWEEVDELFDLRVKRRRDVDGLPEHQAHRVVWPCKLDPCPGCSCCEAGMCDDDA